MTPALFTNGGFQELSVALALFLAGFITKFFHGLASKQASSSALKTITDDYQAISALYNQAKAEMELLRKDNTQIKTELAQAKARIGSYELFLQSRSLETDQALKNVPVVLQAVATHLQIALPQHAEQGTDAAHSQQKL